jgi:plasmid replication initiation protein
MTATKKAIGKDEDGDPIVPAKVSRRRKVVQTNPFLESNYKLGDRAQRLMRIIISQIDDKRDTRFYVHEFSTEELYEALGLENSGESCELLQNAIQELRQVPITIPGHLTKDGADTLTGLIVKGKVHRWKGWTQVMIDNELKPFLLEVKHRFTKYELEDVLNLHGPAIRFYEWFIKEKHTAASKSGAWYVTLQLREIRFRLGMLTKQGKPAMYDRWQDFRRRVLDPVVEEISEKTGYVVSWEVTQKRRISEVIFHIVPKEKPDPAAAAKKAPAGLEPPVKKELDKHQRRLEQLKRLAEKCSEDLQAKIREYHGEQVVALRNQSRGLLSAETAHEQAMNLALEHFEDEIRKETEGRKKGE